MKDRGQQERRQTTSNEADLQSRITSVGESYSVIFENLAVWAERQFGLRGREGGKEGGIEEAASEIESRSHKLGPCVGVWEHQISNFLSRSL